MCRDKLICKIIDKIELTRESRTRESENMRKSQINLFEPL